METRMIRRLLFAILGTLAGQLVVGFVIIWNDHYDLKSLKFDMAYCRPKVEQLWWKAQGDTPAIKTLGPNLAETKSEISK